MKLKVFSDLTSTFKNNLLALIVLITFLVSCDRDHRKRDFFNYTLSYEEILMIKEGDIILRHGYGFVSNMIVKTLAEDIPLSHVGIIAKNSEGKFIVIHSVSQTISDYDGVQEQDLAGFVRDSQPNSIIIVRHIRYESDSDAGKKISDHALHYLQQKIPFDYSFDFESQDRFFCTELIGRVIFDALGDEIYSAEYLSGLSDLEKLKFNVFFDPERFAVVLNHQNRNLN